MKLTYREQLKYPYELNWANEIKDLRTKYEILDTDEEVAQYSKESWKRCVKNKIKQHTLELLNKEMSEQKHGNKINPYQNLQQQKYLDDLQPHEARKVFHVRAGILDVKCVRKYWYSDTVCRLCGQPEEDVDHIVNKCIMVPRNSQVNNVLSDEMNDMRAIAERCTLFAAKVKEMDQPGE